ncbi:porin family protein [Acetobacteroides hydrogenigenes]|uniref:Outer membrane protein with beta-barrel domain n=1 Tax=Acetobacteroides hydrogenigenes TaxID=979970 RepID=A0A4R2EAB0_9BACT|nr:porin family protein [Acetobacteroides hydrogenigenes]TCN65648.1 outer membrane protein with beta-barrel domain [Acetobacteroides hydrogenigenes]
MKRFIIVPLMLAFAISALGQSSKLTVGVESATTITSLRGSEPIDELKSKLGNGCAITASYSVYPNLSISTGLGYERKGGKTAKFSMLDYIGSKTASPEMHLNFDYLILPIKASFQTGGKIKGYINGGVFIGYLLKYTEKWKDLGSITISSYLSPTTSDFKRFDFGITVGAGAYIPIYNRIVLDLGVVENLGLRNIYSTDIKTNSAGLVVGIKYAL